MSKNGNDRYHPLNNLRPPPIERHLSQGDVGNQARILMTTFIRERLRADGLGDSLQQDAFIPPGTPIGPPVDNLQSVTLTLRRIGDELDGDARFQQMINQVSPGASKETFYHIAREIFSDGNYNWGRIVALFYFGYKMVLKALKDTFNSVPVIRGIIEWVVDYIVHYVAGWIIGQGGWESVQYYMGATALQVAGIFLAGVTLATAFVLWKQFTR